MRLVIEIIFLCFVVFVYGVAYGKIRFGRLQSAQPEETQFFNEDAINLQPTCNQLATDCISRQAAIDMIANNHYSLEYCIEHHIEFSIDVSLAIAKLSELPSVQPERSSEIQDILEYLDTVLHPIISPDHWNVYSELHDMISMLPSVQLERKNRLISEIEGKTPEETYDFLSWLMFDYGLQFTDTRQAIIEWLRGEQDG